MNPGGSVFDITRYGGVYVKTARPAEAYGVVDLGPEEVANFGWVPPEQRTDAQRVATEWSEAPPFALSGAWSGDVSTPRGSWLIARRVNRGQHFVTFWQKTGSCVGNGGGQVVRALSAFEAYELGEPEKVILPFYLYTYGLSRQHGGLHGQGDGSFGSSFAAVAQTEGFLDADTPGLPRPEITPDGITWGSRTELLWSDGARIDQKWKGVGRQHVVGSAAKIRNTDELWEAVANGHYATCASDWGGMMQPPVKDGVLLNRRTTSWMHQMGIHGVYDHPQLGRLFFILNSWGVDVHGVCPTGAQPGGFWVAERDMQSIVSQGETFAFSRFQGFPVTEEKLWSTRI